MLASVGWFDKIEQATRPHQVSMLALARFPQLYAILRPTNTKCIGCCFACLQGRKINRRKKKEQKKALTIKKGISEVEVGGFMKATYLSIK